MTRGMLVVTAGVGLGVVGMAVAQHEQKREAVKPLASREIVEKLDGKEATATAVEVALEPGQAGDPHRHPGPAFGYILEGEYEWAIDDRPAKVLKVGVINQFGGVNFGFLGQYLHNFVHEPTRWLFRRCHLLRLGHAWSWRWC